MASIEGKLRGLAEVFGDEDEPQECDAKVAATCTEAAGLIAEMAAALEAMRAAAVNGNRGLSDALVLTDAALARAKGK